MPRTPIEIIQQFLENTTNPEIIHTIVAADATYVSLNFDNPELKKIMPWAGTSKGPQAFIDTFSRVFHFWGNLNFDVTDIFGSDEKVAVFGTFTYKSTVLNKTVTSPFSILAKVQDGMIVYFQFMEDTYATASSFKVSGTWRIHADPEGTPFDI